MVKRVLIGVLTVFCTLLFVFVGLCVVASFYGENKTSCQLASGRRVECSVRGIYTCLTRQKDSMTIETLRHTVSILPTQLQVDGREVVNIPATTKIVNVKIDGGEVTFIADGQKVGGVRR
jgi:hypothetical protein